MVDNKVDPQSLAINTLRAKLIERGLSEHRASQIANVLGEDKNLHFLNMPLLADAIDVVVRLSGEANIIDLIEQRYNLLEQKNDLIRRRYYANVFRYIRYILNNAQQILSNV
jgi:hypothetical protein